MLTKNVANMRVDVIWKASIGGLSARIIYRVRARGLSAANKPTTVAQINAGVPVGECDYRGSGVCNPKDVENASPKFDWCHLSRSVTARPTTMAAPSFPALVRVPLYQAEQSALTRARCILLFRGTSGAFGVSFVKIGWVQPGPSQGLFPILPCRR